jgi:hypothetical protein
MGSVFLNIQWFVEDNWWLFLLASTIFLGIIAYKQSKKK